MFEELIFLLLFIFGYCYYDNFDNYVNYYSIYTIGIMFGLFIFILYWIIGYVMHIIDMKINHKLNKQTNSITINTLYYVLFYSISEGMIIILHNDLFIDNKIINIYDFLLRVLISVAFYDIWFYFIHRLLHHKSIYKYIHKIHHEAINPTTYHAMHTLSFWKGLSKT